MTIGPWLSIHDLFYCHYFLETIKIIHSTASEQRSQSNCSTLFTEKSCAKAQFYSENGISLAKETWICATPAQYGKTFKSERNWVKFLRRSRLDWPKFSLQNFWHGKIQHKFMLKSYYQIGSWSLNFGVKLHFGGNTWEAYHELS